MQLVHAKFDIKWKSRILNVHNENQGSDPVQGTKMKTENEWNFKGAETEMKKDFFNCSGTETEHYEIHKTG